MLAEYGGIRVSAAEGNEVVSGELSVRLKVTGQESSGLGIILEGGFPQRQPLFAGQNYIDCRQGLVFPLEITGAGRFLAIYQYSEWWDRPAFCGRAGEVPDRTQLLLAQGESGTLALLAVCGRHCRCDLKGEGPSSDRLRIRMSSNRSGEQQLQDLCLVLSWDEDPYACCRKAGELAARLTGRTSFLRKNRRYPKLFNKLGWCSWDAFYHKVSRDGLLEKLEEFRKKDVPVRWALIDDGWLDADLNTQLLAGPDADRERFPGGLGDCVRQMKEEYGLEGVGVWHAVTGYWNGLQAGSEAERFFEGGTRRLPDGRIVVSADRGQAFRFYDTWHRYLKDTCGIDFIKVDEQSAISIFYEGLEAYGDANTSIQTALNASAALHFDNAIINCMGMGPEDMWNRPDSAISRSSDDFVPRVENSFSEHVLQNAYNSLLQGIFHWGDWDMFWSRHPSARQSALLRAVSGGPVYTSDPPGGTDPAVIRPLVLRDGTVLRCDDVGLPAADCLFTDPTMADTPMKVINRCGAAFIVAAFHLRWGGEACSGRIRPSDLGPKTKGDFILYDWNRKEAALLREEQPYDFRLEKDGCALFLLYPLDILAQTRLLPAGLVNKYIAPAAMEQIGRAGDVTLLRIPEDGTAAWISASCPEEVRVNGNKTVFTAQELKLTEKVNAFWCTCEVRAGGQEGAMLEIR